MKTASRITLTLAGLSALAAIWAPGQWWQWGLTALVFALAGAGFGAAADMPRQHAEGGEIPAGNATGPHQQFTVNSSATPDEITAKVIREQQKHRPRYGKPSKENDR